MKPSCETVEYARMRLMSVWATAMLAAKTAVMTPTQVTNWSAPGTDGTPGRGAAIKGYTLATRNTPAATMVAAWMSALTGVGPSIASGNQTCSGTWPDLPMAPQKINSAIPVETAMPIPVVCTTSLASADCSRQPLPLS